MYGSFVTDNINNNTTTTQQQHTTHQETALTKASSTTTMATEEVPEGAAAAVTGDGDIESSGAIGVSFKDDGDGGDPVAALKKSDPFAAAGIPPSPYKDRPLGWHSAIEQSVCEYSFNLTINVLFCPLDYFHRHLT
jgi:hypothetical protein